MANCPPKILELIEKFDRHKDDYRSGKYKELQVRKEFIDPMFSTLGWDMENEHGHSERYKEVIHEHSIKIGGVTKAPDYCFRIGGAPKFFLEAKKPSVNIEKDVASAFQIRRYAWSAKLPLAILTDFEEFAVYDCRFKPVKTDKPALGRILYLKYHQYRDKWDDIASVFSQDAVWKGSFDKYVDLKKRMKGTQEVDSAFLKDIESWRDILARNIALRNPNIEQRALNYAVQTTIDRIIFLRICEDRGIEDYGRLLGSLNGDGIYPRLCELFYRADERYNSGLFHFKKEKGRDSDPDELTPGLKIDDKHLKSIIESLYYPGPYEFSMMPPEILGQVYEQFLGKVIRLTAGGQAKVEEKPEVKKAGGVYYTPRYIVDYIVKNTVGKLLEGKSPKQAAKLKILDPACGSGSFLIGAYQYLLDWHLEQYSKSPGKHKKEIYKKPSLVTLRHSKGEQTQDLVTLRHSKGDKGADWRLTIQERKRILLNNIHGVDIDTQAVEVTKLSLLLKVLEQETDETINQSLRLFHERALPDLSSNIKCGNSLIGPDFYEGEQQAMFMDDEERYRINAFDWQAGFPEVFSRKTPGFDAVIGNPPYIRIQALKEWAPLEVEHYKKRFKSASKGNYDIYVVFVENGLNLLNSNGRLGFILPHKFFNAKYGEQLRSIVSTGNHLGEVIHFGDQQVFSGATTYTCLMFLDKAGNKQFQVSKVSNLEEWRNSENAIKGKMFSRNVSSADWNFVVGKGTALFNRIKSLPLKLSDVTSRIFQGIKTGADSVYIVEKILMKGKLTKVYCKAKNKDFWLESNLLRPLIKGGDSKRYHYMHVNKHILFPYQSRNDSKTSLIPEKTIKEKYPYIYKYLLNNKDSLQNREHGLMRGSTWYGYSRVQALDVIQLPKIFTPDIAPHSSFSFDHQGAIFFTGGVAGGYGIQVLPEYKYEYILGILNSKLTSWFIAQSATQMRGGYFSYESRFISNISIWNLDNSDKRYDKMVKMVEQMLSLNKKLAKVKTPHEKNVIQRQIEATDRQIDSLVYKLYSLSEKEIKIVEEATR